MAIPDDNNWQQHLLNWKDRISYLKQNEKLSDFRFIVGPNKKVFPAHKFIFAVLCPECENLFFNEEMKEIELPNVSPEVFENFLNFVYTARLNLTPANIEEMMKLGKLYSITELTQECENCLEENFGIQN